MGGRDELALAVTLFPINHDMTTAIVCIVAAWNAVTQH